ncbi:unnamed protein product [Sphagnum jensenii]|uniref:Uncharacterized protein n=1 Tax=Sphagnum jensenii TaxID=128206 RepID=A0ABP1B135_9BRYO
MELLQMVQRVRELDKPRRGRAFHGHEQEGRRSIKLDGVFAIGSVPQASSTRISFVASDEDGQGHHHDGGATGDDGGNREHG